MMATFYLSPNTEREILDFDSLRNNGTTFSLSSVLISVQQRLGEGVKERREDEEILERFPEGDRQERTREYRPRQNGSAQAIAPFAGDWRTRSRAGYCQLLKDWKPDMSKEELADRIRLYHAAVSARQSRDQESR
jgi:hypothetical protein